LAEGPRIFSFILATTALASSAARCT
jgi:hypothetical protein